MMISSRPANDLAVDVKVEHAAFVSCANTQLTALGENGGILKATVKIVRNPVMARPQGTSGNSKGKRFFDLLSGTSRVRIAPGSPFYLPDSTDLPSKRQVNRFPSSRQLNKKQDGNKKSLVTSKCCQRFSLVEARQIAHCCHPVKGFASGLRPPLTDCYQCAERQSRRVR